MFPLCPHAHPDELDDEVRCLPAEQCLLNNEACQVWLARAHQIPTVMKEIGRLREVTFRIAGEGTGKACDVDEYDNWYRHLFIWNTKQKAIVGSYRLGFSQDILPVHGVTGFYSHSLFEYGAEFLVRLGPAIELGRSFVRLEDQRSFLPLLLLWRGIARVVYQEPQYRRLFGPVSISSSISDTERFALMTHLQTQRSDSHFSQLVCARRPFSSSSQSITTLAGLVDERSKADPILSAPKMPVLLRQYLALNGRMLAFSLDPAFNNTLDGLVLVDLDQTDVRALSRYMGVREADLFLKAKKSNHEEPGRCQSDAA